MAEEQAIFRQGRGSIEQIFSLRFMVEKYLALQDKELCSIFIDFKKVFDGVWHQYLWKVLHHSGYHPKLINLIENQYKKTQSAIRVRIDMTDWFQQTVGVRQGCILSQVFFNIYLEHIMREALDGLESLGAETINNLRFADDIGLLTQLLKHAQVLFDRVDKVISKYGQVINDSKTEWILISTKSERTEKNRKKEGLGLRGKELQHVE